MKAIQIEADTLVWRDTAEPELSSDAVLIDIHATAINRADLIQRAGFYAPPPGASEIMGLECSGTISAIGNEVDGLEVGQNVCALLAGGGYAERVAVPAAQVLPIPQGLSLVEAAALPEVFATAYLNIYMEAKAQVGERVLLHAGASGVGTAAIQLCKLLGNPCFVTAGSADKIRYCQQLGADGGYDRHSDGGFIDTVMQWSDGRGADVILDPVGADYLADNQHCLALNGRLVLIGLMGGANASIDLGRMLVKRQRLLGSTLRSRPVAEKAQIIDALRDKVWPHFANRTLRPIIDSVSPIAQIEQAHQRMQSNDSVGKIVVQIGA